MDVLNRPVWSMLNGPQARLAVSTGPAVRIDPRYGPFAAARDLSAEAQDTLGREVVKHGETWLVEPEAQPAAPATRIFRTAPLLQMVAETPEPEHESAPDMTRLKDDDVLEMTALALATEPGPWGPLTHRYGQFYGIRSGGRLAAMAGERMRPGAGMAEVSGVCTWPEFRGQGLAGHLIRRIMAEISGRGEVPFLHSYAGNAGAIALYRSLGFVPYREMVVTVLVPA